MPIILTHNLRNALPEFDYADVEGVQYQYGFSHRNKVREGRRFIYYRGSLDSSGRRRTPHYFGSGVIDRIELDTAVSARDGSPLWIARIEGYEHFIHSVEFKIGLTYLEPGANRRQSRPGGYFQPGVREIDEETYRHIIELGKGRPFEKELLKTPAAESGDAQPPLPHGFSDPADVLAAKEANGGTSRNSGRRTARPGTAKWVGILGERTVFEYLKLQTWARDVRWLEREGRRPGWDVQYTDDSQETVRIEVKSSTLNTISACDLTANEWRAALEYRGSYRLWFVTGVGYQRVPKLSQLLDPAAYVSNDESVLVPTAFRFHLGKSWTDPVG